jgi:outer membrane protein OmpA-like peptidoglycan-associated protein
MKHHFFFITVIMMIMMTLISVQVFGQFKDKGVRAGIAGGFMGALTQAESNSLNFAGRLFLRHNIVDKLDGDFAATMGNLAGDVYQCDIYLAEYKALYKPYVFGKWEPYVGAGLGFVSYTPNPNWRSYAYSDGGIALFIPIALGTEYSLNDRWNLDANMNLNYAFTNEIISTRAPFNNGLGDGNDAWWGILVGVSYTILPSDNDVDKDGLSKSVEEQLGTDPNKADTDGDGLSDGDEVNKYHTNPLKADSDGDGLSDKDEIMVYKTDPNKADSDGDGLKDGDEVSKYNTDPLKADTDGDGLSDGDEVNKYKTNPLKADSDGDGLSDKDEILTQKTDPNKADTDGDGLSDGSEVLTYKTNPLKVDSDGDGISDGEEVRNGTNPLDPNDPKKPEPKKEEPKKEVVVPKPEPPKPVALKAEVGKAIVLEGVVFISGKAVISPESEQILSSAKKTLEDNPDLAVEIRGYTDNVGNAKKNLQLSQSRAEAVKAWLVKSGIPGTRITAKGYGDKNPIGNNKTPEGRAKNRRIEFFRTK